jgi:hypothetical protein
MTDNNKLIQRDNDFAAVAESSGGQATDTRALNMSQIRDVGKVMAMSGMFPDVNQDSAKAFVKILAGQEIGIPPFQAMGGISIIQGKATLGGNLMAAKVKESLKYDYKIRSRERDGCSIEFFERNGNKWESLGVETFDKKDADDAGLSSREMWKKYPKNMYFNRAISNGVRTYCPDVLGSAPIYTPEEMGAAVDEDGNAVIEPGVTYSQNQPAPALPAPVTDNALMPRTGNPLQLISDDLLEKGFAEKDDRRDITLRFANVSDFTELSKEEWFDVYESLSTTDAETLGSFIATDEVVDDPEPAKLDDVAEVDEASEEAAANGTLLDGVENVFGPGAEDLTPPSKPAAKKPAVKKPTPSQVDRLGVLYAQNGIKTDKEKEAFNRDIIGKNHPISAEDFTALITELGK